MTRNDHTKTSSRLSRRGFLFAGGIGVASVAFAGHWFNVTARTGAGALNVTDAHEAAIAGQIVLVDIRRPDEWEHTGVGQGAVPLDMRDGAFSEKLLDVVDGDRTASIALICARGVRSRALANRLRDAGFTTIIDVPEGMMGSGAGPGWLKTGLPVIR